MATKDILLWGLNNIIIIPSVSFVLKCALDTCILNAYEQNTNRTPET